MAITWLGSLPAVGANNGGDVTLTFSNFVDSAGAGITLLQNDVVVCAYACSESTDFAMSTSSSGWTEVVEVYVNHTLDTNLAAYYKLMGASPDTSFVAVGPGGSPNGTIGVAHAFRGVNTTTVEDATATTASGTGTTVPDGASITPVTTGAYPIVIGAGVAGVGATYTAGADLSSGTNHFRTGNHAETNDIAIGMGFKSDWASGAYDPTVWTGGNVSGANSWAAITMVLRPQPATPSLCRDRLAYIRPFLAR